MSYRGEERSYLFAPRKLGLKFRGHCVSGLSKGSQAEHAGIRVGWILRTINDRKADNDRESINRMLSTAKKRGKPIKLLFTKSWHVLSEMTMYCRRGHRMYYYMNKENSDCELCLNYIASGIETLICTRCNQGRCDDCAWKSLDFEKMGGDSFKAKDFPQATYWFFQQKVHVMNNAPYINISIAHKKCSPEWKAFLSFLEMAHERGLIVKHTSWAKARQLWRPTTAKEEQLKTQMEDQKLKEKAINDAAMENKLAEEKKVVQNIMEGITHTIQFKAEAEEPWGCILSMGNHWSRWRVIKVVENSQADRNGCKLRDRVVAINDIPIDDKNWEVMREKLQYKNNYKLTFKRMGASASIQKEKEGKKFDALSEFRRANELPTSEVSKPQKKQENPDQLTQSFPKMNIQDEPIVKHKVGKKQVKAIWEEMKKKVESDYKLMARERRANDPRRYEHDMDGREVDYDEW